MSTALELRILAKQMENNAYDALEKVAGNNVLENKLAKTFASSILELETLASSMENDFSTDQLSALISAADAFDASSDPYLKKQANLLDDLLLTISSHKNAAKATEDELNRLRTEYRAKEVDRLYHKPKEALDKQNNMDKVRSAIKSQVKTYVPMEAPLQTRYPPDRPGGHQTRIADNVFQDIVTGKIYDYRNGYTTDKGNKIPGGGVEYQIPDLSDTNSGHTLFDTRESVMSRYADNGMDKVLKAFGQAGDSFMNRLVPDDDPAGKEAVERSGRESEVPEGFTSEMEDLLGKDPFGESERGTAGFSEEEAKALSTEESEEIEDDRLAQLLEDLNEKNVDQGYTDLDKGQELAGKSLEDSFPMGDSEETDNDRLAQLLEDLNEKNVDQGFSDLDKGQELAGKSLEDSFPMSQASNGLKNVLRAFGK